MAIALCSTEQRHRGSGKIVSKFITLKGKSHNFQQRVAVSTAQDQKEILWRAHLPMLLVLLLKIVLLGSSQNTLTSQRDLWQTFLAEPFHLWYVKKQVPDTLLSFNHTPRNLTEHEQNRTIYISHFAPGFLILVLVLIFCRSHKHQLEKPKCLANNIGLS